MRCLALAILLGLVGCMDHDSPWEVRVGIPMQTLAPRDLGIADASTVAPGDAWISLHQWYGSDVVYPVVTDGAELRIDSTFQAAQPGTHGTLVLTTSLSRDGEPAEKHPHVQYATIFAEAVLRPTLRDVAAASQRTMITIELEINVPPPCGLRPPSVAGSVEGCLVGTDCPPTPLARRGDVYEAGPLDMSFEVLSQECLE